MDKTEYLLNSIWLNSPNSSIHYWERICLIDAGCESITKHGLLSSCFVNHVRRAPVQAQLCEIG